MRGSSSGTSGFKDGILAAFAGLKAASSNKVVKDSQRKTLQTTFITIALVYVAIFLISAPIRILLWLVSFVAHDRVSVVSSYFTSSSIFYASMWIVPLIGLFVLRNVIGSEEERFFSVLSDIDVELAHYIKSKPKLKVSWRRTLQFAFRILILVLLGTVVKLLSFLPFVGPFIVSVSFMFEFAHKFMKNRRHVGMTIALIASVIFLYGHPQIESMMIKLIQVHIATVALSRELLDPYFSRFDSMSSVTSTCYKERWVLFGFGLPFFLSFCIPFLGLAFWRYAEGAAANLVYLLHDKAWAADGHIDCSTQKRRDPPHS